MVDDPPFQVRKVSEYQLTCSVSKAAHSRLQSGSCHHLQASGSVDATRRIRFSMNCPFRAFGAWSSRTYRMNYLFLLGASGVWARCHRISSRTNARTNAFEIYNDNLDSASILKIPLKFGQNDPKLKFLHFWFIPAIFSSIFIKVVIMICSLSTG